MPDFLQRLFNVRPEERLPLDTVGIDYAIDNRFMEERILPLARDRGIGVLVYAPFGRTWLWERVRGHEVPDEATIWLAVHYD
ncbi:hypothetical protein [Halomonas sp. A11-A]|uniref:hypothetical protein n=1 Tax=Halomonas sp. A11-A TaxID=2183985 RepID=UPI000D9DC29D|nr:hypothetical protein [Halomonas sp. A11-A]PWV82830.1 hypothetical protein DER72_1018 [Halomonas sp. A11-A]